MAEPDTDFVSALVEDPAHVPDLAFLSGFVGKSSMDGHRRVYLNVVLSEYLEVPEAAILKTVDLPPAASPLGVTCLWIKPGAALVRKGKSVADAQAGFFGGPIQQGAAAWPACGQTPAAPPADAPAPKDTPAD